MFIIGNFLIATGQVLNIVLTIYLYIVIISALISWVNPDPHSPIVIFLRRATEPVYRILGRYIPPTGGLDLTPIVVILIIYFLQFFLVATLITAGNNLAH